MLSQEKHHVGDASRVLILPSTCSTSVVKKSSVGHVPHEPSKGAVGHDMSHSSVPISASTAAHGGHITTSRTYESKQKHSLLSLKNEQVAISPTVQKDNIQSAVTNHKPVSDVFADSNYQVAKAAVDDYKIGSLHLSHADIAQTLEPVSAYQSSSTVSLSDLVEENPATGQFSGTALNHKDTTDTKNSLSASTSENVHTELVSLKEQLVVQSKVCT